MICEVIILFLYKKNKAFKLQQTILLLKYDLTFFLHYNFFIKVMCDFKVNWSPFLILFINSDQKLINDLIENEIIHTIDFKSVIELNDRQKQKYYNKKLLHDDI